MLFDESRVVDKSVCSPTVTKLPTIEVLQIALTRHDIRCRTDNFSSCKSDGPFDGRPAKARVLQARGPPRPLLSLNHFDHSKSVKIFLPDLIKFNKKSPQIVGLWPPMCWTVF